MNPDLNTPKTEKPSVETGRFAPPERRFAAWVYVLYLTFPACILLNGISIGYLWTTPANMPDNWYITLMFGIPLILPPLIVLYTLITTDNKTKLLHKFKEIFARYYKTPLVIMVVTFFFAIVAGPWGGFLFWITFPISLVVLLVSTIRHNVKF